MDAKIRSAPSPTTFATVWSGELEQAVRAVAGRTRITRAQAERIGDANPEHRIYRDNVLNYLDARGVNSVTIDRLIDSGYRYALNEGERVKGSNNRISLVEARGMALDIRDDFRVLRGREPLEAGPAIGPSAQEVVAALDVPVRSLAEWWESGDNGVNVSVHSLAGIDTLEAALAAAPLQVPWTVNESNLELLGISGARAIAQFADFAADELDLFMEEPRPEVPAFAQAIADTFGPLPDVRVAVGHDLGANYLLGRTNDGWALLTVQPYRD